MFKFIWNKKYVFGGIALVVVALLYFASSGNGDDSNYDTAKAEYVDIVQEVSVTGTVEADPKVNLRFQSAGQVEEVYVEVGDFVSAGQTLANLDLTSLAIQVNAAEADLALAQANYDQAVAGSTDEAIDVAEAAVAKAAADLEQAENDLETTTILAEDAITSAQLDYDNAVATYGEDLVHAYEDAYNVIDDVFNEVDDSLRDIDTIVGVDDEEVNDDIELALKGGGSSTYTTVQGFYEEVSRLYDDTYDYYVSVEADDYTEIDDVLVDCSDLLNEVDKLLEDVDELIFNSNTIGGLSETVKETKRAMIATELSDINTIASSLDDASQAIESAGTTEGTTLNSLVQALETAEVQAAADVASAEVAIEVYEALLAQAEANLADIEAGPRDVDLASLIAAIDGAEAALSLAQYNLSEAYVVAPTSGVITEVYFDEGENVTASEDFLVMISDTYQIAANVSETDITKVSIGDKVTMTLDAFSYDKEFEAEIVEIDPAETVVQGVIYYQITAVFVAEDTEIKPGMTANMDVVTAEVNSVLGVPLRSIKYDGSRTYVLMVDSSGSTYEVDVEIGVEGDQYVEVLSGVDEGDEVVTYVR